MHQLDTIKQNLLCPDYYDPYLQKEHAEYLRINGIEEPFEITQTFVKAPHWSLVASLTNKTVRQLPSCATKIFTGEERRCIDNSFIERIQIVYEKKDTYQLPTFWESPLQQAAERFRRMLLPKQYQEDDEDDLTNARFFPPLAVEAYHQILGDEKNSWGIVASENLTVHFVNCQTSQQSSAPRPLPWGGVLSIPFTRLNLLAMALLKIVRLPMATIPVLCLFVSSRHHMSNLRQLIGSHICA
ncbi:hypothetical protein BX666DRAFT_1879075 [Dichotomocladium elegans]|nr:hypothetical protein BX666DRAFT_1879075 [Dichotomocladium elegans]